MPNQLPPCGRSPSRPTEGKRAYDRTVNSDDERGAGPAVVALLLALITCGVLWHQIADLFLWWWDTATGITGGLALGELVVFAFGLIAALLVTVVTLVLLEKILSFGRDLGRSFSKGWRAG